MYSDCSMFCTYTSYCLCYKLFSKSEAVVLVDAKRLSIFQKDTHLIDESNLGF